MEAAFGKCPKLPWMIDFFSTEEGRVPNQQLQAINAESRLDYLAKLNCQSKPARKRLTSIMCTLGPKSSSVVDIERLIFAGMNIARLKMPFFTKTECENVVQNIKDACDTYSKRIGSMYPIAIALDLRGPEIRTGSLKDQSANKLNLEEGQETFITSDPSYEEMVTKDTIYVDYQAINNIVEPGDKFKINNVRLSALEIVGSFIRCIIERAGSIADHAMVELESSIIELPSVSEVEVQFAIDLHVDLIIVSNVRDKWMIREVRRLLGDDGKHIQVVAKIENLTGIKNIEDIIKEADAIFVSRSDLEHATKSSRLFIIQKQICAACNKSGKPVIIAPQMLESMNKNPEPTRAEILDVTNCVLDGADCIVLSRETASGKYGLEAVTQLSNLCKEAESAVHQRQVFLDLSRENPWPFEPIYALGMSTVEASMKANAACIILLTTTGRTAEIVARYRPRCPIIAITRHAFVARKLRMFRGVEPIYFITKPLFDWNKDVRRRIQFGITYGKYYNFIKAGDTIIILNGTRSGSGFTNSLSVFYASDFDTIDCVK